MTDVIAGMGMVPIGRQGENLVTRVVLPNIRGGAGGIVLLHQRSRDKNPYPVTVTEDAGHVYWVVSSADTAYDGAGRLELQWQGSGGEVLKSRIWQTYCQRSLTKPTDPPEPWADYIGDVARNAAVASSAAKKTAEMYDEIAQGLEDGSFKGEKGDPGEKGEPGSAAAAVFTDSGNGNLVLNSAADQTAKRYFASALFPGLGFKYIPVVHGGTYADPYGIKAGSGVSLVDAINALTEPGIYTIYQNRASTDVPDGAKKINSSLRGLCCLSQINKHYAYILMIDQASNLYVQHIQGDVGGGWKTMFCAEDAAGGIKNPNALTIKIGSQNITYDGSSAQTVEIADGSEVAY